MKKTLTRSPGETESYGFDLGTRLQGGEVVLLVGTLGSGKTTLTKGIARSFAIDEIVTSPSFAIMNEYPGRLNLYHFDFYRIDDPDEMEMLLQDYLDRGDGVVVIEWGEPVQRLIKPLIRVELEIRETERLISEELIP